MQVIQSNPQNDPRYYVGQMLNNLVSEILEGQEKQRRAQELRSIGQWASGGFAGEMPNVRTQFGQSLTANLLDALYQPITPYQQMASERLKRYRQIQKEQGQEEADKWLNRSPVTINMPGFSTAEKKALAGEMDVRIEKAKKLDIGGPNYKDKDLFREWENFISTNTFDNDNQKLNAWNAWRLKVEGKGNEVDWDPNDPKWRKAIGLPVAEEMESEPLTSGSTKASDRIASAIQGAVNTGTETAMKMGASAATAKMKAQKSPYPDYPDAFLEDGVWKVMRDGKKYRIEE